MKISVITISFNSAKTIEETIQSVITQDYDDFEYVIIDGDSTDGTQDIVKKYTDKVNVFISEKDSGISDAFNKGILHSTGELIVMINSDDRLIPGALKAVAEAYTEKGTIFCTNVLLHNDDTGHEVRMRPSRTFPRIPLLRRPAHQGMYIPRAVYDEIGLYDTRIKVPIDIDLIVRAYTRGVKFVFAEMDTAIFRIGGVTSIPVWHKRKDFMRVVTNNGGNVVEAFFYWLFVSGCEVMKKILNVFNPDMFRKLRYRK